MGSGISTVCGSKRSVLIANSVRKLPTIPEDDTDSDLEAELEINPRPGKLHPAESRDSGIGENEIPCFYQRNNGSDFAKSSSSDSSPEKSKKRNNNKEDELSLRPSRPQSCRLGHRGHHGSERARSRKTELSESQIRRLVQSARSQPGTAFRNDDDDLSADTLSDGSISPTRESRPCSARRKCNKRNRLRTRTRDGRSSAQTLSDLDSSTDTEISDTDMLSIPDETGAFPHSKDSPPAHRGWVRNEDFTDVMVTSSSTTPRVGAPSDMYRIVSGTYSNIDMNLAKKASERSISSIILTPMDGAITPTNSECSDAPNEMCYHCEGSLDDLVTSLTNALERRKSRGPCTQEDYEHVMKGLRYQLVGMAMGYMCRQSTPRIEVQGEQSQIFSDDSWRVQIRLREEDEELIESSEKILAKRLAAKKRQLTREGISILLAEHLKTIEKLQQVQEAGLRQPRPLPIPDITSPRVPDIASPRQPASDSFAITINKRPGSASKIRKLNHDHNGNSGDTNSIKHSLTNGLPPVGNSKGIKSRQSQARQKIKAVPVSKGDKTTETVVERLPAIDSPQSSPETKAKNRSYVESGIDSEVDEIDTDPFKEEDTFMYGEFVEAIQLLWDSLTIGDLSELFKEYRRRETDLFSERQQSLDHPTGYQNEINGTTSSGTKNRKKCNISRNNSLMGQSLPTEKCTDKDVQNLDEEFVKLFHERKQSDKNFTSDEFVDILNEHMKKTRLIRVQSFREDYTDFGDENQRSNSFTGFTVHKQGDGPTPVMKRQHSFNGTPFSRQSSFAGGSRQNSFVRSLPGSRQSSFCRSRSRGSTGSSNTFSTTSSGVSSGLNSDSSDRSGSLTSKSALSREFSYGLLNDFEDIKELDEEAKTARDSARDTTTTRIGSDTLRPPSGRKSNPSSRATSGNMRDRDRRRGQVQVHGLGLTATPEKVHGALRKIEEDTLPKVEEMDTKITVRSRPDSGIAVSTSSASYSSSEPHKERDFDDQCHTTSCHEMVEKVIKVLAEQHNDMKSLVAAITKGLYSEHLKSQALYCWLTSQELSKFEKINKKSGSPSGKLRHLTLKKTTYCSIYMEMLKMAGLKSDRIDGYVKSSDYLPGNTVQTSKCEHSWVAVCMDGQYRLVDPQYGAMREKFVQDHHFATSPDVLLLSHFPKDKRWQLMTQSQSATVEDFEGMLKTWPAMFHFTIRPLNMKSVIRTYDGRLSITVLLQNVAVNPQLEYAGPGKPIDSDTLEEQIDHEIRDVDNAETYHVTLPQEGTYYFTVYAHVLEDCVDVPVFQYKIEYQDELL